MTKDITLEELGEYIYDTSEDWIDDGDGDEYAHHLDSDNLRKIMKKIKSYTKQQEIKARIDELGSAQLEYGHQLAQTNRDGKWLSVKERYDELTNQLKEELK